jgi:sortase A
MAMRNLTAQELAALEIIRRGDEAVTGIQGTFNGEDAIFIVQVSAVEGSDELHIYPLAMLLRDEDMPFVGGPHEEHPVGPEQASWPDQTAASRPEAWPDEGVVSPPASQPAAGWPDDLGLLPPEGGLPPEGRHPPTPSAMSPVVPAPVGPPRSALRGTTAPAGGVRLGAQQPAESLGRLESLAPYTPDGAAEEAARRAEETRVGEDAARRAEKAARRAEETQLAEEAARRAEEAARRAEETRAAEETARRAEAAARRAEETRLAEEAARRAEAAAASPHPTRRDIVRQRREAAARGEPGTTKRRRAWPTLDLSVRTSRILLAVGRTLIAFGTLMLLFVAYELWGTNIAEARSQKQLKREFAQAIAPSTTTPPGTTPTTTSTTVPTPVPAGEAVALIEIPKIGVNKAVVNGVGVPDLKKGPGHYPDTPLPGEAGNAAIAGHRTTYGAPFNRLDELKPGDQILVATRTGKFRYQVDTSIVVKPTEIAVLNPTRDNRLTLTTCNPKYSARQRLIVVSHLVGEPPPPPQPTLGEQVRPTRRPAAPDAGLSGEATARRPALLWGAIVAAVAVLIWLLGRMWRRWPVYLLGTPVFLVLLFIFFENISRLLPANV